MDLNELGKKCEDFIRKDVSDLKDALTEEEEKFIEGYSNGMGSWNLTNEEDMRWYGSDIITEIIVSEIDNCVLIHSVFSG